MAKRSEIKRTFDVKTSTMKWTFPDPKTPPLESRVPIDAIRSEHPQAAVVENALLLSWGNKIGDAGAIKNDEKGKPASDAVKRAAMQTVADNLRDNVWTARGSVTIVKVEAPVDVESLVAAIVAVRQKPADKVLAYINSCDEATRRGLAFNKDLAFAYVQAFAAKTAKADSDATKAAIDAIGKL